MAQYQIFLLPLAALALVIFFPLFGRDFSSSRSWRSRRRRRTVVGRIAVLALLLATLFAVVWPIQGVNTLVQGVLASAILMAPVLLVYMISSMKFSKEKEKHRPNAWQSYERKENAPPTQNSDQESSPKDNAEAYSIDLSTVIRKKQRHTYRGATSEPSAGNINGSAASSATPKPSSSFEPQSGDHAGNTRVHQKTYKRDTSVSAATDSKPSNAKPESSSFTSDIASFADTKIYQGPGKQSPSDPTSSSVSGPKLKPAIDDTPASAVADLTATAEDTKIYPKASPLAEPDVTQVKVSTNNTEPTAAKHSLRANDAAASEDDTRLYQNTIQDTVFEPVPTQVNASNTPAATPDAPSADSATNDKTASPIQGTEFYPETAPPSTAASPTNFMQSKPLAIESEDVHGFTKNTESSGSATDDQEENVQDHLDKVSSLIQSHDLDEAGFMSPESDESRAKTKKFRDRRMKENAALITTSGHNADLTKLSTSQIIQLVATLRRDKNRLQKLVIAQQASIESERQAHDQTRILTRDAITVMRSARNAQKNAEKLARRERSERQRVEEQYKKIAHALQNAMSIVETRMDKQSSLDDPASAVKNAESA